MNDQELAAYNLKLAADTKEMVGNILLELFSNYDFLRVFDQKCGYFMADQLSGSFATNPRFQNQIRSMLINQLNKS
jgi:hypothetical protein